VELILRDIDPCEGIEDFRIVVVMYSILCVGVGHPSLWVNIISTSKKYGSCRHGTKSRYLRYELTFYGTYLIPIQCQESIYPHNLTKNTGSELFFCDPDQVIQIWSSKEDVQTHREYSMLKEAHAFFAVVVFGSSRQHLLRREKCCREVRVRNVL
jgi:hypothetical protein